MLEHSFIHIAGVGAKTEQKLWATGATRWNLLTDGLAGRLLRSRAHLMRAELDRSAQRLADGDAAYFEQRLPAAQSWRLFGEFASQAAYLDIETTGMGKWAEVTTVVLHRDGQTAFFVRDRNLHELPLHLAGVKLLVTYNGRCFDWPMLKSAFARLPEPQAHLDLRSPFHRLGFRGGLKAIEPAIGLHRPAELEGVDGWAAVWMWRKHLDGDRRALPTILRYCAEDVLNLKFLAEWVYNRLAGELPVGAKLFDNPAAAVCDQLPEADAALLTELRKAICNQLTN